MAAIVMLMLVTCLMVAWLSETAYAAGGRGGDEGQIGAGAPTTKEAAKNSSDEIDMMEKKGIEGLFAGKSLDADRAPTRMQKFMGLGSIVVMIAVLKYL